MKIRLTLQGRCGSPKCYNSNGVMAFFCFILETVLRIRRKYRESGDTLVEFQALDQTACYDISQTDCVQQMIVFLQNAYGLLNGKEWETGIMKDTSESDLDRLLFIKEELDKSFLDDMIKNEIKIRISRLADRQKKNGGSFLWNPIQLSGYLDDYYGILCLMLRDDSILRTEGVVEKILIPLLNLGTERAEDYTVHMALTAPAILPALNLFYERLQELLTMEFFSDNKKGSNEKKFQRAEDDIYKDIFMSKLHQIFRSCIVFDKSGDLYYTEVPDYGRCEADFPLSFRVKGSDKLDSFQGIRELRLAEKIIYECMQYCEASARNGEETKREFRVALIGEVDPDPLKELIIYIRETINNKEEYKVLRSIEFNYTVYTIDADETAANGIDHCEYRKYNDLLLNRKKLEEVLEESDLLMFLDSCQLYDMDIEDIDDFIVFYQNIMMENYSDFFAGTDTKDLKLNCKFMELYNALMSYCWKGKLGSIRKTAKENLIKFLRDYVKECRHKTVYLYVSDIKAFSKLTCIQNDFVRIEKYNEKEIGIIRFTTNSREVLPVRADCVTVYGRNILVFNMWQVVKHVVINERQFFTKLFLDKNNMMLDDIYIGFDYTDWRENIKISYYYEGIQADGVCEKNLKDCICLVVRMLLGGQAPNMYDKYMRKAFLSFLYGAVKSVEDLVFLHLFKKNKEMLGECSIIGLNPELKNHYNLNCKYSHKKNYWEAMEKFDASHINFVDRYLVMNRADNNGEMADNERSGARQMIADIMEACEQISYSDSILYQNCMDLLHQ